VRHACPGPGACGGMYTCVVCTIDFHAFDTELNVQCQHNEHCTRGPGALTPLLCQYSSNISRFKSQAASELYVSTLTNVSEKKKECLRAASYMKRLLEMDLKPR
jgi:hypothetical protein